MTNALRILSLVLLGALIWLVSRSAKTPTAPPTVTLEVQKLLGSAGQPAGGEFAQVLKPRVFSFPRDNDAHRDFRSEWWYVTGNLKGEGGHDFAFQVTFFRQAGYQANLTDSKEQTSAWRSNQLYMAHFTLLDVAAQKFYPSERFSREALGLAGCQEFGGFPKVWTEGWSFAQLSNNTFHIEASDEEGTPRNLSLDLEAVKAPVLQGDNGLSQKGPSPGEASYYYSIPRMKVTGKVELGGQQTRVEGLAWFDREWSSRSLPPDLQGWDWFSLQMEDNTELMFYRLRRPDGSASKESAGSYVDAQGKRWALSQDNLSLTPTRWWNSPVDGVRYPVEWKLELRSPVVRSYLVKPRADNQELNLAVRYWEGAVDVGGEQGTGVGFLELVGYPPPAH